MADQMYLSYWLRGFTARNMLRHFDRLLRKFPFSTISPAGPLLRIYAIEFAEPPLIEQRLDWNCDADAVIRVAGEFQNDDCVYQLDAYWDLWKFSGKWTLAACPATLSCFGPSFQNDLGDHLRIECGIDSDFLPDPEAPEGAGKIESNIKGLLRLAHELDSSLPVKTRRLWSESGENFAEKFQAALR